MAPSDRLSSVYPRHRKRLEHRGQTPKVSVPTLTQTLKRLGRVEHWKRPMCARCNIRCCYPRPAPSEQKQKRCVILPKILLMLCPTVKGPNSPGLVSAPACDIGRQTSQTAWSWRLAYCTIGSSDMHIYGQAGWMAGEHWHATRPFNVADWSSMMNEGRTLKRTV